MDGLEFTEKIVGHLVTLVTGFAWPLVVFALLVTQRVAIANFIKNIKKLTAGKDGVTVESQRVKKQLDKVAATVAEIPAAPKPVLDQLSMDAVPATDVQTLVDSSRFLHRRLEAYAAQSEVFDTTPTVVIEHMWKLVQDNLYRLAEQEEPPSFMYLNGNDLLLRVSGENLLDRKLLEAIAGLLRIWSDTVTSIMGWSPTREQAREFADTATEVLTLMEPYMQVGYKGWKPVQV